jgi:hypothetical protein
MSDQHIVRPLPKHRIKPHTPSIHVLSGIQTHDPSVRPREDSSDRAAPVTGTYVPYYYPPMRTRREKWWVELVTLTTLLFILGHIMFQFIERNVKGRPNITPIFPACIVGLHTGGSWSIISRCLCRRTSHRRRP